MPDYQTSTIKMEYLRPPTTLDLAKHLAKGIKRLSDTSWHSPDYSKKGEAFRYHGRNKALWYDVVFLECDGKLEERPFLINDVYGRTMYIDNKAEVEGKTISISDGIIDEIVDIVDEQTKNPDEMRSRHPADDAPDCE